MTLLIIDDEPIWLAYCQRQGCDTCATLEEALIKIETGQYKLVIVSSRLMAIVPELAQRARVEVATGQPTTGEARDAFRAGAEDYFAKDFHRRLGD